MTIAEGAERVDVPYLWPTTRALPAWPPQLIYLDLNHWVALSKAHSGHPDGARHADVLAVLRDAVNEGAAVFPLSDSIYTEVCKKASQRSGVICVK